jgi:hypothetical protein
VPEGSGLLIFRKRDPEQFVRDVLLPRHPRELRLTAVDADPPDGAVAGLLAGPEAVGQVVTIGGDAAAGPRERLYLAATAQCEPPLSATCWDGADLRADAPEGHLADAVAALVMMVRTAAVSPDAADKLGVDEVAALTDLIDRAKRAVGAIPEHLQPQPRTGLTSVLGGAQPETAGPDWRLPGDSGAWWSDQSGEEAVDILGAPVETRPTH